MKQAPFYVLLGAQMPAILVETSFISNARECERLVNKTYQERLTDAIISGIKTYIKEINPTALMDRAAKNGRTRVTRHEAKMRMNCSSEWERI